MGPILRFGAARRCAWGEMDEEERGGTGEGHGLLKHYGWTLVEKREWRSCWLTMARRLVDGKSLIREGNGHSSISTIVGE